MFRYICLILLKFVYFIAQHFINSRNIWSNIIFKLTLFQSLNSLHKYLLPYSTYFFLKRFTLLFFKYILFISTLYLEYIQILGCIMRETVKFLVFYWTNLHFVTILSKKQFEKSDCKRVVLITLHSN